MQDGLLPRSSNLEYLSILQHLEFLSLRARGQGQSLHPGAHSLPPSSGGSGCPHGGTGWSQRPPGRSARLNTAREAAHPAAPPPARPQPGCTFFPAASPGRIPGSSAPDCQRIQPRVSRVRRVILSPGTRAMSGERGRAARREEEVAVGWQLPSKSGCRSDPCRGAAAPRQVPSLLEWLSHSGTYPQSVHTPNTLGNVGMRSLRWLEMPLPELRGKRDQNMPVRIVWGLFDSKYGGEGGRRETEREREK